ncbi:hypothetical protein INR49_029774, partial [Caranx melampygus]
MQNTVAMVEERQQPKSKGLSRKTAKGEEKDVQSYKSSGLRGQLQLQCCAPLSSAFLSKLKPSHGISSFCSQPDYGSAARFLSSHDDTTNHGAVSAR